MGLHIHGALYVGLKLEASFFFDFGKKVALCGRHGAQETGNYCAECGTKLVPAKTRDPSHSLKHAAKYYGKNAYDLWETWVHDQDKQGFTIFRYSDHHILTEDESVIFGKRIGWTKSHREPPYGHPIEEVELRDVTAAYTQVEAEAEKAFGIKKLPLLYVAAYISS